MLQLHENFSKNLFKKLKKFLKNNEFSMVMKGIVTSISGLRGGGGGVWADAHPRQGFDHLPTQRFPPLYYFEISIFGRLTLKFF